MKHNHIDEAFLKAHSPIIEASRAAAFLLGHVPSFTNVGYECRKAGWQRSTWDFSGQRWLISGASAGIGREIARAAAEAGATVLAAARRPAPLQALASSIWQGTGRIVPLPIDLSLVSSVDRVVGIVAQDGPIDVLVNNVGVLLDDAEPTTEGRDLAFATNLLVPFHLTTTLDERGLMQSGATIITMSSGGMYNVALTLDSLAHQKRGDGVLAYARHKRAQVALNAYWRTHAATNRQYYVMHPGWVDTPGVERSLPLFRWLMRPLLRDAPAGADTALWLAQKRPEQSSAEGVWFDRELRPAHALAATSNGSSTHELLQFLSNELAR